jgi:hypothetical protein
MFNANVSNGIHNRSSCGFNLGLLHRRLRRPLLLGEVVLELGSEGVEVRILIERIRRSVSVDRTATHSQSKTFDGGKSDALIGNPRVLARRMLSCLALCMERAVVGPLLMGCNNSQIPLLHTFVDEPHRSDEALSHMLHTRHLSPVQRDNVAWT